MRTSAFLRPELAFAAALGLLCACGSQNEQAPAPDAAPPSDAGSAGSAGGSGGSAAVGGTNASGGTAGSGGGGATSADADAAGPWRGPTPPRDGMRFPFPQNRESASCVYPSAYRNEDVQAAFKTWRDATVTSDGAGGHLRVRRPNEPGLEPGSTVSEGIAYGMLIAVYMGEQQLFDELWKYERLWLDDNGLMDWYINAAGTQRLGTGAATDADEDMAFALVIADRQWGGQGSLDRPYLDYARDQIQRIWDHEIYEGKLARAGDHWGDWSNVNISYFAPAYYRVFSQIDGNDAGWQAVIKTVYDTIDNALNATNGNETNGLVPAWCTSEGVPGSPGHYQYDSCRTPFRIGLDWCMFGEPRARQYVQKTSQFFGSIGADQISDGYELNGSPRAEFPGQRSAAFIGPAAVGAMSDAINLRFVDDAYAGVATNQLLAGGVYYETSWTVLSLLMLTGNFLDYTAY